MAQLAGTIAVNHNPWLQLQLAKDEVRDDVLAQLEGFREMGKVIAALQADTLLVVGSDHFSEMFTDNMAPFLVIQAPAFEGIHHWEQREFGLEPCVMTGDPELSRSILRGGFEREIDFAFSDEYRVDHSFTVPLGLIRPELDLPVAGVVTNTMAPPLPPATRFFNIGRALREIVERAPLERRVVAICSGHLATEVGGPRQFDGSSDPEFDEMAMAWIRKGDVDECLRMVTPQRLVQAGNVTAGFLNFVLGMGLADGCPAETARAVVSRNATAPFVVWR